ncbi:unnamed protein product [Urochloa decumbens]|uniref:WAT1-related protein n=1 Tax=Urochloa decumbens TaxID=240449 RepID=A0ABC9GQB3_9POAL
MVRAYMTDKGVQKRMKKKAYAVAMVIQVIMASTVILSKAAFDRGLSPFVYIFYRLAAASLFLTPLAILLERRSAPPMSFRLLAKMFLYALLGNTVSLSLYNVSLKYTSAAVGIVGTWCVGMKGPVFLAMWNPLSLLLTVLCSSLLGETVHLGSILGGILLVGGLYCVLWGKNKEETRAPVASDNQEQSREQADANAGSCTPGVLKDQDEDKQAAVGRHKYDQQV